MLRIKVLIHVRQQVFPGHIFNLFSSGWSSQSVYTYMYACIFYYFKKMYCCFDVCVHVCVYVHVCVCLPRPEEGIGSPGTDMTEV